jgi:hypothetical protein
MVDGSILSEYALHRNRANGDTAVLCFRFRGEHDNNKLKTKKASLTEPIFNSKRKYTKLSYNLFKTVLFSL